MIPKEEKSPRVANWLLSKCLSEDYLEEFFGDLLEVYEERIQVKSKAYARFMYWIDALHLVFGFTSVRLFKTQNNNTMMLKNMFKIAWRNAIRQKQFSSLNLLGLTLGIATSLIIGIYVHQEMSFDNFQPRKDRIYRVNQPSIWGDWTGVSAATGPNVAVALREDIPEFEEVTRLLTFGSQVVNRKNAVGQSEPFQEDNYIVAEENFFNVFSFDFIEGSPENALHDPRNMIMTKTTAERYFGYDAALGETVEVKNWEGKWEVFTITGVIEDIPYNSHLQFDMMVSLKSYQSNMDRDGWKWIWTAFSTYGLVEDGVNIEKLREKIQAVPPKWAPPTTERIFNQTYEEFTAGNPWTLYLQPLASIYLTAPPYGHSFGPSGNPQGVRIFTAIGILILVLSSINFMNLSTARSSNRAKEVGVRKVLGSRRKGLIQQFIFESVLFVFISTVAALILMNFSLPSFNGIADTTLNLSSYITNPAFIGVLLLFVLTLGILAGSYPAFYLSSFKPVEVLKGKLASGLKGKGVRNGLIIFQFSISIALIICAFFVQRQLKYASSLDIGFSKENLLQIHNIDQLGFDTETLKTRLESNAAFSHVGKSFGIPPNIWSGDRYKATGGTNPVVQLNNLRTEADYLDLLGLEFLKGRNFDANRPTDKYTVIINEEAVKMLGWADDDPIGKSIALASGSEDQFQVIGVVENFNFGGLKQEISPLIIINQHNDKVWDYGAGLAFYSMRLNEGTVKNSKQLQRLISEVEEIMAEIDPSVPFEYSFMDEDFETTFRSEQRMGVILNIFTIIAIVIACLGLFGLAAFSMEQRMKELGIRKVLGAKTAALVLLFSTEFVKLILLSIVIASSASYFLVDRWLNDFAYRTPMSIWVFVGASVSVLAIALATISHQSISAALRNPIKALKDE